MGQVVFFGDEITAAGFRLAGVACHSPERDELPARYDEVCDGCELILITAQYAKWLGASKMNRMALEAQPLVAIVQDIRGRVAAPQLEHTVRRELGIEI